MPVPILKQGKNLIVSIPAEVSDQKMDDIRNALADRIGRFRTRGIIVDVSALGVMDSYATRMLMNMASASRLRGAKSVIVGIQPEVAFSMVQLGLDLGGVTTALDLDEGLEALKALERVIER